MNTCKDCLHWTRYNFDQTKTHYDDIKLRFGEDRINSLKKFHNEESHYGKCDNEKFNYDGDRHVDGLHYWDAEGYFADFETGEDFGCIHWKERS